MSWLSFVSTMVFCHLETFQLNPGNLLKPTRHIPSNVISNRKNRQIMNDLSKALDNFWNWSQISENEYLNGKPSPSALQAEWEENYPYWKQIEEEFAKSIEDQNKKWNEELTDLMITAIALDHVDGLLFGQCHQKLNDFARFISRCINSKFDNVRLEIALRIKELPLTNDLIDQLKNDKSEMIRKFASKTNG
jgi:hypothetical protein